VILTYVDIVSELTFLQMEQPLNVFDAIPAPHGSVKILLSAVDVNMMANFVEAQLAAVYPS
jgi:hypothetical protein